jgi:hypothetical protein
MGTELQNATVHERFEHLVALIGSQRFLKKLGLGNEVPFFICPFNPDDALDMANLQQQLVNRLSHQGVQVLQLDLYDIVCEIMRKEGDWDWYVEKEATIEKQDLLIDLQGILDTKDVVVPEIARRMAMAEFHVLFLSGAGEVFPYIRSHNVLNNLQKVAKDQPTVLFFPGEFIHSSEKGTSLNIFGRLHDDKYYRAFNIYDCEV